MYLEIIILFFTAFCVVLYYFLTWNFNYWHKQNIPGPRPKLFFSWNKSFSESKKNPTYEIDEIYRKYKNINGFIGIFNEAHQPELIVTDPKNVQEVLIKNFKNFHDNTLSLMTKNKNDIWILRNPFVKCGEEWKEFRSEISPAVSMNRLKLMYPIIENIAKTLNNFIESQKNDSFGIDAKDLTTRFTADSVANTVFRIEGDSLKSGISNFFEESKFLIRHFLESSEEHISLNMFTKFLKGFQKSLIPKEPEHYFTQIIKDIMKSRENTQIKRIDILEHFIKLEEKKEYQIKGIVSHLLAFVMDGIETSSVLIAHCLLLLGRYPETQNRLRSEINKVIEEYDTIPFEVLMELPYLDQCIHETLRLFPVLTCHSKLCTESCELTSSTGKTVQILKGTTVHIPAYSIHHDENYYPNPEEFNPSRFDAEFGGIKKFRDLGVLLPFGDGPRICVGMKFGLAQSKAAIVEVVRNWQIEINKRTRLDNKVEPKPILFMLDGGIWLNLRRT